MKHNWKKELKYAFEPPEPLRKKTFTGQFGKPGAGFGECILVQAGYIRKWVWLASAFVCLAALSGSVLLSKDMLWWICAWTPLFAVTVVSENGRSECYGMAELEMVTRFSLRSVLLARMGILGAANLLFLSVLFLAGLRNNPAGLLQTACYMLNPFLLTAFAGFSILRRFRGREAEYLCAGAAVIIGVSVIFLHDTFPSLYGEDNLIWWAVCAAALLFGTGKRYCQLMNGMEDLIWNWS